LRGKGTKAKKKKSQFASKRRIGWGTVLKPAREEKGLHLLAKGIKSELGGKNPPVKPGEKKKNWGEGKSVCRKGKIFLRSAKLLYRREGRCGGVNIL